MRTIGFAGTAKNTGKTTAALHVLNCCTKAGLTTALTSIGYDGESLDTVTGLPKPRYYLPAGTLLATAERCLMGSSADIDILENTGIETVLGTVLLAKVRQPGFVVLAGPNRETDLHPLMKRLEQLGSAVTLIDGALNRLVPLIAADSLVLSTGAALDKRIDHIAAHIGALTGLFQFPAIEAKLSTRSCWFETPEGNPTPVGSGSLLGNSGLQDLLNHMPDRVGVLHIPGSCSPRWFETLLTEAGAALQGCRFCFGSPLKLIAGGSPLEWQRIFLEAAAHGQTICYRQTLPVRLVTINPFYPHWQPGLGYYEDRVEKDVLRAAVQSAVAWLPVINVREPDLPDVFPLLDITAVSA